MTHGARLQNYTVRLPWEDERNERKCFPAAPAHNTPRTSHETKAANPTHQYDDQWSYDARRHILRPVSHTPGSCRANNFLSSWFKLCGDAKVVQLRAPTRLAQATTSHRVSKLKRWSPTTQFQNPPRRAM